MSSIATMNIAVVERRPPNASRDLHVDDDPPRFRYLQANVLALSLTPRRVLLLDDTGVVSQIGGFRALVAQQLDIRSQADLVQPGLGG
jgi:hypothetical protein